MLLIPFKIIPFQVTLFQFLININYNLGFRKTKSAKILSPYICIKGNSNLLDFLRAQSSIYYQEYSFVIIIRFHVKILAKNISHVFKQPSHSCNRKDHDVLSQFHFQSPFTNTYFT